jgi:hypothetical protein
MSDWKEEEYVELLAFFRTILGVSFGMLTGAIFISWQFKLTVAYIAIVIYSALTLGVGFAYTRIFKSYSKSLR